MTVQFKKSLKPEPGGWVAVDYETHKQKPGNWSEPEKTFTELYKEFKKLSTQVIGNPIKTHFTLDDISPPVKEPQTMIIYTLVVLTTEAESAPKWAIWDSWLGSSSTEFLEQFKVQKEIQQQRLTKKEITGYKFVAYQASDGYSNLKYLEDYCETKFEPKPKVYINGPKKSNEFLTKKAKQYANAKNI